MASKPESRIVRGATSKKKVNAEQAAVHQKAGQVAYKKGNLQGAIDSFTQVRFGLFTPARATLNI